MTVERSQDRISTGVPGLDELLEGGWPRGSVHIIQGTPGAGKTILGNQACFRHAADGGSAVYITLLAESHARMLAHLERMSFYDAREIPDRLYYVSTLRTLEAEGLDAVQKEVRRLIDSRNATLLVIDGLLSIRETAPTQWAFKRFLHGLQTIAAMSGCVILLHTNSAGPDDTHPEYTVVDGVLELTHELARLRALRHLRIIKLRGTDPILGLHSVHITNKGICVSRRIETQLTPRAATGDIASDPRLGFGIPVLDDMLHGGVPSGSITMVLGPSGTGKTTLGLHFLGEGLRRGESAVFFGFYEKTPAILRTSKRLNLPFEKALEDDRLEIVWHPRAEGIIDLLGERLLTAVGRRKAKRLFIDGLDGFQVASELPDRVRDVLSVVTDELESQGVTTLYTAETRNLFGPHIDLPVTGVSTITHNMILMRHVELNAHVYRLISVLKVRDHDHDTRVHEFEIAEDGIKVAETPESAGRILAAAASQLREHFEPPPPLETTRPGGKEQP